MSRAVRTRLIRTNVANATYMVCVTWMKVWWCVPTESEYEDAAEYFKGAADNALEQIERIDKDWSDVTESTDYLQGLFDRAMSASIKNITSVSDQLVELQDECLRRAEVCRDHDQAIRVYNNDKRRYDTLVRLQLPPGKRPRRPDRPAAWVTPSVAIVS